MSALLARCRLPPNRSLGKLEPAMNLSCPLCVHINTLFRAGVLTVYIEEPIA
jgi:hypothetical protein